jgi:transposase
MKLNTLHKTNQLSFANTNVERYTWHFKAVGMHNGGRSHRRVADHFRVNHSIIVRLMQRFRQTGNVTDRPRAGRPRKATPREDRLISRRTRQRPFSTAGALRGNLAFGGHISTRTVIRRLHRQGMRARRPQKTTFIRPVDPSPCANSPPQMIM